MRGILIALLGAGAVAPAKTVSSPEDRAIYNVTRLIQYHSAEHGGWLPANWEQVREEIPAAAELLDKNGALYQIEERYGFLAPPLNFADSPGSPPRRLIGFSRWFEVKGPWYSERIERRLLLLDREGNLRMPSLPERFIQQQLARSGTDPAALFAGDPVFVQRWGIFSRPGGRRSGIFAAVILLLIVCSVWVLRRLRGRPIK